MCWKKNKISGKENHFWLVSSSDFWGDPEDFHEKLTAFTLDADSRMPLGIREGLPYDREIRLGYIGVPPIAPQIFDLVEELGARFVYHETQRQFSMPVPADDLVGMYLNYTYPYTLHGRSIDIIRDCSTSPSDPMASPEHRRLKQQTMSRALITACKPYWWIDEFAPSIKTSPELIEKTRKKWAKLFS